MVTILQVMNPFYVFLNSLSPISDTIINDLSKFIRQKSFDKGERLLESGHICKYLFFINEGLVKMSFNKEEKQFIMRFFAERSMLTGLDSFVSGQPSNYTIEALEPTSVSMISKSDLEELGKLHHGIDIVLKNFFAMVSLNMMNRISEMLEEDASERYNSFLQTQGKLLKRISLGELASYLGITQVSLSRIRAKR